MTSVVPWWAYALASAGFAAATAILAKIGVQGISSNLATAIRTAVVRVFAWGVVLAGGELNRLTGIGKRSLLFLVLSGIGTGASWLAYFRAPQLGPTSRVAPLDKVSPRAHHGSGLARPRRADELARGRRCRVHARRNSPHDRLIAAEWPSHFSPPRPQ